MANIIEVSALNRYVKALLEEDAFLTDIAIKGEVSNFSCNSKSGHCYFTLKDEKASIKAVMFSSAAAGVSFKPLNGMSVLVRCRVSLYERDGAFQIYVDHMFQDGLGLMQHAFEELKQKLGQEGLFDLEHKKPLPLYPKVVGLATSKTGAALQDILKVTQNRYPFAHFVLAHTSVQGDRAEAEIVAAINMLDSMDGIEVIIVARGGGSAEDLSVFNSEKIARAVFACSKPIVSAIGHEIDFHIIDFVADLRASTPSAAVEIVFPDVHKLYSDVVVRIHEEIQKNMHNKLRLCYNSIVNLKDSPILKSVTRLPKTHKQQLNDMFSRLQKAEQTKRDMLAQRFKNAAALAGSLNPYAVLSRGYAFVTDEDGGAFKQTEVAVGKKIEVHMLRKTLECTVQKTKENIFFGE